MPSLWLLACGLILGTQGSSSDELDAIALVQRSAADAPSMMADAAETETETAQEAKRYAPSMADIETETLGPLKMSAKGPMAMTELGPIQGREMPDHFVFRGIPYVETPQRFERAMPKKPWAPKVLQAREYARACIGAGTSSDKDEEEDCLNLNVWMPKGGRTNMPVIVYFHGGMNMHGAGAEALRQGDGVVQSAKYPTIFINFDYRLGIFGWIYTEPNSGVANTPNSLGLIDQQEALRWVHRNIAAFGGDPNRVALMGQSEGAGNIMNHVISPGSAGLFYRVIFHSPPAEIWTAKANEVRTKSVVEKLRCGRATTQAMLQCLRAIPARKLWSADWVPEDLSRNVFSAKWTRTMFNMVSFMRKTDPAAAATYLGYHAVPDGHNIPGEVHDMLPRGNFSKVPILLTVSKNETEGVCPGLDKYDDMAAAQLHTALGLIAGFAHLSEMERAYSESLEESGIVGLSRAQIFSQMLTDKMWTCEAWSTAKEITQGGGSVQVGMFWKSPRYDPVGTLTNKVCTQGATCHAAEMLYSLPQGRGVGVHGSSPEMLEEAAFVRRYADEVLSFVHGFQGPWEPYRKDRQVMTFYDEHGPRVVEGYRQKQCAILDKYWGDRMPAHMQRRAFQLPDRLKLVYAERIEDIYMWAVYQKELRGIREKRGSCTPVAALDGILEQGHVLTSGAVDAFQQRLDAGLNEHYLWHGTSRAAADCISEEGFKIALAGSHAGTMFGNGGYFAECASKADEYARDKDGDGVYPLLLCRVVCGEMYRTLHSCDGLAMVQGGEYDAILGDREAAVGTYREFVVYSKKQIYPEYKLLYQRVYDDDTGSE